MNDRPTKLLFEYYSLALMVRLRLDLVRRAPGMWRMEVRCKLCVDGYGDDLVGDDKLEGSRRGRVYVSLRWEPDCILGGRGG